MEVDLRLEAAAQSEIIENTQKDKFIEIPEIFWDLTSKNILTTEWVDANSSKNLKEIKKKNIDFNVVGENIMKTFLILAIRDGFFHADMHPGNIQVSIAPESLGQYISLDFGIVGTLTQVDKNYLAQNFTAFFRRDYKRVAELHIESGWVPPETRVDELEAAVRTVCEPYFDRPLKEISLGLVLMRLFQTSRRFHVEIQPQLVLLQKTLLNIEGLGRQLDPDLDLWQTAKPFLEKWMIDQLGPKRFLDQLQREAPGLAQLLPALPRLLATYLEAGPQDNRAEIQQLLQAQNRTNRLLQGLIYAAIGFLVGLVAMQILWQFGIFGLV